MSAIGLLSPPACHARLDAVPSTSGRACHASIGRTHLGSRFRQHAALKSCGSRAGATNRGRLQVVCAVKKTKERNLVCCKVLTAKPEHHKTVVKLCQQLTIFSKERMKSNKTSGILAFEASQDRYEPNVIHFWERYDGNRSMGQHNSTDEYAKFMTTVQQYLQGPVGMILYEYHNGKMGISGVQGGPKGEGGLDDATGAGGDGGASYKQKKQPPADPVDEEKPKERKDLWGLSFKFPWQKKKAKK